MHLVQGQPKPKDPDKALACFGAMRQDTGKRFLYLCDRQLDTKRIILVFQRLLEVASRDQKRVLIVIWNRASWHKSQAPKQWLRKHNRAAKRKDDVRLLTYLLPVKSPWLNPMETDWLHVNRKIAEPDGELSVAELKRRLCAHFQVELDAATLQ